MDEDRIIWLMISHPCGKTGGPWPTGSTNLAGREGATLEGEPAAPADAECGIPRDSPGVSDLERPQDLRHAYCHFNPLHSGIVSVPLLITDTPTLAYCNLSRIYTQPWRKRALDPKWTVMALLPPGGPQVCTEMVLSYRKAKFYFYTAWVSRIPVLG